MDVTRLDARDRIIALLLLMFHSELSQHSQPAASQPARQPGSQAARQPGSQAARQPGSQAGRERERSVCVANGSLVIGPARES
jgi:hypothetical protein